MKIKKFPKGLKTRVNQLLKQEIRLQEIADLQAEEARLKAKLSKPIKSKKRKK